MSNELARRKAEMLRHDRDDTPMHTPGPDAVEAFNLAICEYSDGIGRTYDTPECDDAYNAGRSVAELPAPWHSLCAAAPDLLEALRSLLSASADAIRYVPADGSEECDLCDAAGDAMIFARAAIARAEGRGA